MSSDRPDAIVIGAGMAGVTAARALCTAGLRVLIVEARDRLGGRICTLRDFCTAPVEAGAELIHGAGAKTWPDVRAAGLRTRHAPHVRGVLINLGDTARWLLSALASPKLWPAFSIFRRLDRAARARDDISAAEFIAQQGYRGAALALATMALSSHLPGNPEDIGIQGFMADGVPELEMGSAHRISDGYDRLIEHIAKGLNVEYEFVVNRIAWSADGVAINSTDGRRLEARAAVVTVPPSVVESGSIEFVPELPEAKRVALAAIVTGPVLKLLLLFDEPFWPRRLSMLLCGAGPATLYWNVSYGSPSPLPVLSAYCTGARAVELGRVSEEEAVGRILADLRSNFRMAAPPLKAWRRIDWSRDPFSLGGFSYVRPGAVGARATLAASSTGRLFWAGSETATVPIAATVEGAFTSGLRAASDVMRALEGERAPMFVG